MSPFPANTGIKAGESVANSAQSAADPASG